MPSDPLYRSIIKDIELIKAKVEYFRIGYGHRLSLSWMIEGMYSESRLIIVDNDPELIDIAHDFLGLTLEWR